MVEDQTVKEEQTEELPRAKELAKRLVGVLNINFSGALRTVEELNEEEFARLCKCENANAAKVVVHDAACRRIREAKKAEEAEAAAEDDSESVGETGDPGAVKLDDSGESTGSDSDVESASDEDSETAKKETEPAATKPKRKRKS